MLSKTCYVKVPGVKCILECEYVHLTGFFLGLRPLNENYQLNFGENTLLEVEIFLCRRSYPCIGK